MAIGSSSSVLPLLIFSKERYSRLGDDDLRSCHPRNFWGKAFNVVLFSLKNPLRDKHREVAVLNSHFFDLTIKPLYDYRSEQISIHLISV